MEFTNYSHSIYYIDLVQCGQFRTLMTALNVCEKIMAGKNIVTKLTATDQFWIMKTGKSLLKVHVVKYPL